VSNFNRLVLRTAKTKWTGSHWVG